MIRITIPIPKVRVKATAPQPPPLLVPKIVISPPKGAMVPKIVIKPNTDKITIPVLRPSLPAKLITQPIKPIGSKLVSVTTVVPKLTLSIKPQPEPITLSAKWLDCLITYSFLSTLVDATGKSIQLDDSQLDALLLAAKGENFSIIGKAGSGKSTLVQAICILWIQQAQWESIEYRIQGKGIKHLAPSIAVVAFTNKATNNIREKLIAHPLLQGAIIDNETGKVLGAEFGCNVTTIHNLLEYSVEYTVDADGNNKRRYFPKRDKFNKLAITHLVLEEASMVGVGNASLWQQLYNALPSNVQIMMLGDINQTPPVIGKPVLAYALQQLKVAELTTIHRTALDNPIIQQAHNCLQGKPIVEQVKEDKGVRRFKGPKTKMSVPFFYLATTKLLTKMIEAGEYDPNEDMILCPYYEDKDHVISAMGIAKRVAFILARKHNRLIHQILTGFSTTYLAVGDKVFVDKKEGIVTNITNNVGYVGRVPRPPSHNINYYGHAVEVKGQEVEKLAEFGDEYDYHSLDIESLLNGNTNESEKKKRAASHSVTVEMKSLIDGSTESTTYSSVGDFASLSLGYALSIHRSQGSEWPNVILAVHDYNTVLLFRELIYTGMFFNQGYLDQEVDIVPKATPHLDAIKEAEADATHPTPHST